MHRCEKCNAAVGSSKTSTRLGDSGLTANVDTAERRRVRRRGWWLFILGFMLGLISALWVTSITRRDTDLNLGHVDVSVPRSYETDVGEVVTSSIAEVLRIAEDSLDGLRQSVDDYTATLIKQESIDSVVGEPHEMLVKVQCKHRGGAAEDTQPMRVYLRFIQPANVAGREVIWGEDLHDGKMVAHEAGLMGMLTVRLDPNGMIAMRGQKYPISDIGLTNLLKKLIERGQPDLDNPNVSVTITKNIEIDGLKCDLIQVRHSQPSGGENDFSLAEICLDRTRNLPIRYTAYGWPLDGQSAEAKMPLLESYTYLNIRTNVGLTELDFDPANPEYQFR